MALMFKSQTQDRLRTAFRGGRRLDLFYLLEQADKPLSSAERVEWLEQLVFWVRGTQGEKAGTETRVRSLLQRLNQKPEWKAAGAKQLRALLREASSLHLFTETGVPSANVFTREMLQRLVRSILPPPTDPGSLANTLERVFWNPADPDWLLSLPIELRDELIAWLSHGLAPDEPLAPRLAEEALAACVVMTVRAAEIAVREDVVLRAPEYAPLANPFFRLRERADLLLAHDEVALREQLEDCHHYLATVREHLEQFGVSVDLVFQLERAKAYLERLDELAWLVGSQREASQLGHVEQARWRAQAWIFLAKLVHGGIEERRLGKLFRDNLSLIARKTVERTGDVGEDYITRDASDYQRMLLLAAGGGAFTAVTAMVKFGTPGELPPFVAGLFASANYSISFLIMHFLHLKLATKQPSATAAALAGRLAPSKGDASSDTEFVDEVARISRSQFAAIVGNLAAVVPAALLFHALSVSTAGHGLLSEEKSLSVLASIDPLATLTIFYAALTGVLLWLSGFAAAWVENAYVYYRVPQSLRSHRFLKNLLGPERLERWVRSSSHHVLGAVSAVALGLFLGFTPELGHFFGLPLDVRHITLTTGSATFAIASLDQIDWRALVSVGAGIFLIGVMNFGVSFALALGVATRARDVKSTRFRLLLRKVAREALRRPAKFFFPGRG